MRHTFLDNNDGKYILDLKIVRDEDVVQTLQIIEDIVWHCLKWIVANLLSAMEPISALGELHVRGLW